MVGVMDMGNCPLCKDIETYTTEFQTENIFSNKRSSIINLGC